MITPTALLIVTLLFFFASALPEPKHECKMRAVQLQISMGLLLLLILSQL